jgi:hypothetical protein
MICVATVYHISNIWEDVLDLQLKARCLLVKENQITNKLNCDFLQQTHTLGIEALGGEKNENYFATQSWGRFTLVIIASRVERMWHCTHKFSVIGSAR